MPLSWKNRSGFTLIELLIVTSMLAVVSLAIYATFNNGLKIWQKVNRPLVSADMDIFLDKWTGDLKNSMRSKSFSLRGNSSHLEIPTLVNSAGLGARTVGEAVYSYDPQSKAVSRQQSDVSQLYTRQAVSSIPVLTGLGSLKFEYYYYDKLKKEYLWREEWRGEEGLPLAVKVEFGYDDPARSGVFTKTVSIPVGG